MALCLLLLFPFLIGSTSTSTAMFDWLNAVAKLSLSHRVNAYFGRIPVLSYLCISRGQAQTRLGGPHDVIVPAFQAYMTLSSLP
jgi:hypothetical protein